MERRMLKQKRYAIFIDIDGTLYTSANGTPKENIEAIRKARQEGHMVFINTGRSYGNIPEEILEAITLDGYISALGCDIRFQGKQLYSVALSKKQLRSVAEYYLKEDKFCLLEGEEDVFVINPLKNRKNRIEITSSDDFEKLYPESRVNIFACRGSMSDEEKELFKDEFNFVEHPAYYEFVLKGNNKARGMDIILNHIGLSLKDSIAIGDSMNDFDMLEHAGFSIAMEDSPEEVIEICDAVTKSADDAGVAAALRKYISGN
jgi:Cof subfamily protein (haloacid dehalogenase superfamily)